MFKIDKEFNFSYGHRVWTQELNTKFSVDNACKCRFLHGHNGTIKIGLEATQLKNGMVADFKHLNFFKKIIDDDFDHKFIWDRNDPVLEKTLPHFTTIEKDDETREPCDKVIFRKGSYKVINPQNLRKHYNFTHEEFEIYEGLVIVNFVPTSENLSKMFFEICDTILAGFVDVSFVDFWETPKSHCRFYRF